MHSEPVQIPQQPQKHSHTKGDLYYGSAFKDNGNNKTSARHKGLKTITGSSNRNMDDPKTIDHVNDISAITSILTTKFPQDRVQGYFYIINLLERNDLKDMRQEILLKHKREKVNANVNIKYSELSELSNKWITFLHDNLNYLRLDKHFVKIFEEDNEAIKTQNKLTKNLKADLSDDSYYIFKTAMQQAINDKSLVNVEDQNLKKAINSWFSNAFFRRTSKLGIKWTVEQKKTIHMNMFSNFSQEGMADIVAKESNSQKLSHSPITHSEIRYIYRNYGHDHENIDLYFLNSQNDQNNIHRNREQDKGQNYIDKKIENYIDYFYSFDENQQLKALKFLSKDPIVKEILEKNNYSIDAFSNGIYWDGTTKIQINFKENRLSFDSQANQKEHLFKPINSNYQEKLKKGDNFIEVQCNIRENNFFEVGHYYIKNNKNYGKKHIKLIKISNEKVFQEIFSHNNYNYIIDIMPKGTPIKDLDILDERLIENLALQQVNRMFEEAEVY